MATATKQKEGEKYVAATGRRKTAIARARLTPSTRTGVTINGKDANVYFSTEPLRVTALEPFLKVSLPTQFSVSIVVRGGGIAGQATAVRHAISRALIEYDPTLRTTLKKEGFLKRDPRAKERRKFGFVKARKRKQWSKR
jgi:small subunit ribosomal protein S9